MEQAEDNAQNNYTTSSLRRRHSGRRSPFKSSPVPQLKSGGLKFRSTKKSLGSADSSPTVYDNYKPVTKNMAELRTVPMAHELAFYVAMESSKEVMENWEAVVKAYSDSVSKNSQPDDSLGPHIQLLYNSTQSHFDRLAKIVEVVRKECQTDLAPPIYNFYTHEKARFYEILQAEAQQRRRSAYDNLLECFSFDYYGSHIFRRYVKTEALTSLVLDSAFNGRLCGLPKCIFMVPNLERLSLRSNNLRLLPADIGRLHKLRCLELSHNRLKNDSIPYTLSYCSEITTLLLDYNSLDAIPGFVLKLKKLRTLHRHGNQNYFRSTFMWYGCETRERIRTASFSDVDVATIALNCATQVQTLNFWAAHAIISSKANYFLLPGISEPAKDYISDVYKMFNICAACNTASLLHSQGYFVFTFRNPFVGNTCVPFQHWTCSKECAVEIEVPARRNQIMMAKQQQQTYNLHVRMYSRSSDTIAEDESSFPNTTLLCTTCHPERVRRRRRFGCRLM